MKKLIVGGFNRVYEIGKQFRNESITTKHNPEFTSLEFYITYKDYNDLMKICEDMMSQLVFKITGSYFIKYGDKQIDFNPPFKKIDMVDELEKIVGTEIRKYLGTANFKDYLIKILDDREIICDEPKTVMRLLDKLVSELIEPSCINPTFIINHPSVMSPLAKQHRINSKLSERFELFINGMEIANAYTELNDPTIQRNMFELQQKDRQLGDIEIPLLNEDFIDCLEYGLPPTGGFGCGLDRIIMLLTDNYNIKEVITFPISGE